MATVYNFSLPLEATDLTADLAQFNEELFQLTGTDKQLPKTGINSRTVMNIAGRDPRFPLTCEIFNSHGGNGGNGYSKASVITSFSGQKTIDALEPVGINNGSIEVKINWPEQTVTAEAAAALLDMLTATVLLLHGSVVNPGVDDTLSTTRLLRLMSGSTNLLGLS